MSIITRKLQDKNKINVAGPTGGGGIILQPQAPVHQPQVCPKCDAGGGSCVPDNFGAWWVYTNQDYPGGNSTQSDLSFYNNNICPGCQYSSDILLATVIDPAVSSIGATGVTSTCCTDIDFDVVISGGITYLYINAVLFITSVDGGGGDIEVTPVVCGERMNTLKYTHEGI